MCIRDSAKVKDIAEKKGFALKPKDYKKNPDQYPGSIVDVSNVIRVAITGRQNSPDLWEISQALGEKDVYKRQVDCSPASKS